MTASGGVGGAGGPRKSHRSDSGKPVLSTRAEQPTLRSGALLETASLVRKNQNIKKRASMGGLSDAMRGGGRAAPLEHAARLQPSALS